MTIAELNDLGFKAFLFLFFSGITSLAVVALVGYLRFGRSSEASPRQPRLWALKSTRSIRTHLSRREIVDRLRRYVFEGGVLDVAPPPVVTFGPGSVELGFNRSRLIPVIRGMVGSSTFTTEFAFGDSRYVVRGRIIEGTGSRILVLRCTRRVAPWWVWVPPILLAPVFLWYLARPAERPLIFGVPLEVDGSVGSIVLTVGLTLATAVLLPLLGLIPAAFVDGVNTAFSIVVEGEAA